MTASFLHPCLFGRIPEGLIDWAAVGTAEHACCCPGRPVALAVLPPAAGRLHHTDLLFCERHIRAAREALRRAGAAVLGISAVPR